MDSKKLAKVIKIIVEHELKKQLPALKSLIKEEVTKELLQTKKIPAKQIVEETIDPFSLANSMLDTDREEEHNEVEENTEQRRLSKNPMLNEILNQTKPFSQTNTAPSALDQYGAAEPSALNEHHSDMDKTISLDSNGAQGGIDVVRAQMAAKMGYGNMAPTVAGEKPGMGVETGLPALDRILNRDNSKLVQQFRTRK
jgi:hypothetical protein